MHPLPFSGFGPGATSPYLWANSFLFLNKTLYTPRTPLVYVDPARVPAPLTGGSTHVWTVHSHHN